MAVPGTALAVNAPISGVSAAAMVILGRVRTARTFVHFGE
jgi:hypothetical protein